MPHRLIKTGLASALHWSGAERLFATHAGIKHLPLVIGYHRVVEDFGASAARYIPSMLITTRTLERHLDWLGHRYDFVTLDDVAAVLEGSKRFTRPAAVITFDDGYLDVYEQAFPILKRKGIPAAIFVVTDLVGSSQLLIYDELFLLLAGAFASWRAARQNVERRLREILARIGVQSRALGKMHLAADDPFHAMRVLFENLIHAELRRVTEVLSAEFDIPDHMRRKLRMLEWGTLAEMARNGFTIGSHSKTHALLTNESADRVADEVSGSRRAAEQALGKKVEHFAYPDGRFNARVVQAVAAAGYRSAYTMCLHRDVSHPALTVRRVLLWESSCVDSFGHFSPAIMSCEVNGVFDLTRSCKLAHG